MRFPIYASAKLFNSTNTFFLKICGMACMTRWTASSLSFPWEPQAVSVQIWPWVRVIASSDLMANSQPGAACTLLTAHLRCVLCILPHWFPKKKRDCWQANKLLAGSCDLDPPGKFSVFLWLPRRGREDGHYNGDGSCLCFNLSWVDNNNCFKFLCF